MEREGQPSSLPIPPITQNNNHTHIKQYNAVNIKGTFATTFWAIFVAMVFVGPNCAIIAGFLSFCVLIGILVATTDKDLTEEDKSILSWVGTAASSVILLGVVYWGIIQ